jgi:hypothetical protein
MMTSSKKYKDSAEKTVRDIRRRPRRHYSAEEKIRIVLEGLRGEDSIAEMCRREAEHYLFHIGQLYLMPLYVSQPRC